MIFRRNNLFTDLSKIVFTITFLWILTACSSSNNNKNASPQIPTELPIANAGLSQKVTIHDVVILEGAQSNTALTENNLSYQWQFVSTPKESNTSLQKAIGKITTFIPDNVGEYIVQLIITNGEQKSVADFVTVSVFNIVETTKEDETPSIKNSTPVAVINTPLTIRKGVNISVDASQSYDEENDTLNFTWKLLEVPLSSQASLLNTNAKTISFTPDIVGEYTIELAVSDGVTHNNTIQTITAIEEDDVLSIFQWYQHSTQASLTQYVQTLLPSNENLFLLAKSGVDIHNKQLTYQGAGITVAVVDTGVKEAHPDLAANIDSSLSIRYSDSSNDASADQTQLERSSVESAHGTCCAGIIAAVANNEIGVRGIAPKSRLVGINVFSAPTTANFVKALQHHNDIVDIYSNSWGDSPGAISDAEVEAIKSSATRGREGKGSIFVFAAGNEASFGANANYFQELNSKYVFTIGALTAKADIASYSNPGANVLVSSFGGEIGGENLTIVTTDLTGMDYGYDTHDEHMDVVGNENGDYTHMMNGTSAACPMATAVIALMLEANRDLTIRDIRYILVHTATQYGTSAIDNDAQKNGAGLLYSHGSGFGGIDADAAITMAKNFVPISKEIVEPYYPDNLVEEQEILTISAGKTKSQEIEIPYDMRIEFVDIKLSLFHITPGALEVTLTSPSGMVSTLSPPNNLLDFQYRFLFEEVHFGSVAHLDEKSKGTWKLTIANGSHNQDATLTKFQLQINGRELWERYYY
jgi:proprotein convertase subtilisin/kexin type 2